MPDRILRRREVETRCGLSRSTIYAMMDRGAFPRPVRLSTRAVGWKLSDITDWVEGRVDADGED